MFTKIGGFASILQFLNFGWSVYQLFMRKQGWRVRARERLSVVSCGCSGSCSGSSSWVFGWGKFYRRNLSICLIVVHTKWRGTVHYLHSLSAS